MKDLRVPGGGKGFSPEAIEWMTKRSEAFAKATSAKTDGVKGPGNRMTYGFKGKEGS